MATAGKNTLVQVSTATAGTYTTIASMNSQSGTFDGTALDVTAFGAAWKSKVQGLKDAKYEVSGFWESTNTAGQTAVRTALVNDSTLFVQVLIDGTTVNYFKQEIKVTNYSVKSSVDGLVELSMSFEGTGTPTLST
jgi:predicted secreted protein